MSDNILEPTRKCMARLDCDWCESLEIQEFFLEFIFGWYYCNKIECKKNLEKSIIYHLGNKRLINILPWLLNKQLKQISINDRDSNKEITDKILDPTLNYSFMRKKTNTIQNANFYDFMNGIPIFRFTKTNNDTRLYVKVLFPNENNNDYFIKTITVANLMKNTKNNTIDEIKSKIDTIKDNWSSIVDYCNIKANNYFLDIYKNLDEKYIDYYIDILKKELDYAKTTEISE